MKISKENQLHWEVPRGTPQNTHPSGTPQNTHPSGTPQNTTQNPGEQALIGSQTLTKDEAPGGNQCLVGKNEENYKHLTIDNSWGDHPAAANENFREDQFQNPLRRRR